MKERINIISTYKPYSNKAKGSLLSAFKDEDFEEGYWKGLLSATGEGAVVIGGDFNLRGGDLYLKIADSGLVRGYYEEGQYTFKSNIGEEHKGKIIDHVLTRGYPCEATVSQNGRFLIDHIR